MTKQFLQSFRSKVQEAQLIRSHLVAMESRIYTPKGQRFSTVPRSATGKGRTMEDLVDAHLRLRNKYIEILTEVEREQLSIENAIAGLDTYERMLIRCRYIDILSWQEVCEKVGYSWTQTHRLHSSALRKLEEIK